jgi:general secretion pathway protein G
MLALSILLTISSVANAAEQAPIAATRADLHGGIKSALDAFVVDCGRYPTTAEGFTAMLKCPTNIPAGKWHGPYFYKIPQDVWKHDYAYRCPGTHNTNGYDLYSCGFDGISRSGGDDLDDINNWDPASPHGGTDYYMNKRELFLHSPAFPVFFLALLAVTTLGGTGLIASNNSRRFRALSARHPTARAVVLACFLVSLAAIILLLSFIRVAG